MPSHLDGPQTGVCGVMWFLPRDAIGSAVARDGISSAVAISDCHHTITWGELGERSIPKQASNVCLKAEPTIEFVVELLCHLHSGSTIQLSRDDTDACEATEHGLLLFKTSGTTGEAKLVGLTRDQIKLSISRWQACLPREPHDCALIMLPLWHVHGLICLLRCLSEGTPVILRKFCPLVDDPRVTWISVVPTMLRILKVSDCHLRYIRVASAPLSAEEQLYFENIFKTPIYQHYGMTEAAHFIMGQGPGQQNQAGSVGRLPDDGLEVKIIDGQVHLKGQNIINHYLNTDEGFTDDGFLKTGDLGEISRGELFLRGRIGDIINRGGEKINPLDVEEAASKHVPGDAFLMAVGIPNELYGQAIGLIIQTDIPFDNQPLMDIKKPLRPDRILVIPKSTTLPQGPTGKILRRQLIHFF